MSPTSHPPSSGPHRAPSQRLAAASRELREHSRMLREYSRWLRAEAVDIRNLSAAAPQRHPAGNSNPR